MRWALILSSLALAVCAGCTSQACRPCGPGFLGNILIPQGIAGVDFRDACYEHDACYSTDCPRKACDTQFRDHMLCDCECSTHPTLCRMRAWQWYWLTRLGGGPGYVQSQMQRGCECECCAECEPVDEAAPTASDGEIPAPAID
jgi:hypothetical protein